MDTEVNLISFQKELKKRHLNGYIIPRSDIFGDEEVQCANERLRSISGFSGSAGLAIILKNKNYLFVDGRYTIQARIQSGKNFKIITIPQKFPKDVFKTNKKIVIGFDPKLHSEKQLNFLFGDKNIILKSLNKNLIDIIWHKKPKDLVKPFFALSKKNTGQSSQQKIMKIRNILLKKKNRLFIGYCARKCCMDFKY